MKLQGMEEPIMGFYTTRRVVAPDEESAIERAKVDTLKELLSLLENHLMPERLRISAEFVTRVAWLRATFTRPPSGFSFYIAE